MFDRAFQNSSVNESYAKSSPELRMLLKPFWTEEAAETWLQQFEWAQTKVRLFLALIHLVSFRPAGQFVNVERLEKVLKAFNSIIPRVNAA